MQAGEPERTGRESWAGTVGAALVAGVILLFLPLAISVFEFFVFGTDHWEDLLRKLGVHSALGEAYKPFVAALRWVVRRFRP
jgi:hypothetical protein